MAYTDIDTSILIDLPADAPIQLFDLKSQQASIRPALEKRWIDILDHGFVLLGVAIKYFPDIKVGLFGVKPFRFSRGVPPVPAEDGDSVLIVVLNGVLEWLIIMVPIITAIHEHQV